MKLNVKINQNNDGESFIVVEKGDQFSIIQFIGYSQYITRHNDFIKTGSIKNPFKPIVYGVGYFGFTSEKLTPKRTIEYKYIYEAWKGMLRRCYENSDKFLEYKHRGCFVTKEWHSFRNFYIWAKSNISNFRLGFELDKDLIGNGVEYSPNNCVFLPKQLNHMLQSQSQGLVTPEGVKLLPSGRFQVNISILKNKINLGTYDKLSYASKVYKTAKTMLLKKRASYHLERKEIPEWIYHYINTRGWVERRFDSFDVNDIYSAVEDILIDDVDIMNNDRLIYLKHLLTEGNFRDYPNRKLEEISNGELVGVHL